MLTRLRQHELVRLIYILYMYELYSFLEHEKNNLRKQIIYVRRRFSGRDRVGGYNEEAAMELEAVARRP